MGRSSRPTGRPAVPIQHWGWLPLLAGVALYEAVIDVTGVPIQLKWPNDLLVERDGRKVAGILAQTSGPAVVIGIGLNVDTTVDELPVDTETILGSVAKTGRLLIVDEAFAPCGLGAEIAARVVDAGFDDLDAPIRRLNGAFAPTPYSPPLEKAVTPQVEDIVRAIRELSEE